MKTKLLIGQKSHSHRVFHLEKELSFSGYTTNLLSYHYPFLYQDFFVLWSHLLNIELSETLQHVRKFWSASCQFQCEKSYFTSFLDSSESLLFKCQGIYHIPFYCRFEIYAFCRASRVLREQCAMYANSGDHWSHQKVFHFTYVCE